MNKLLEDEIQTDNDIIVPITAIPEYSGVNVVDMRIKTAKTVIGKIVASAGNASYSDTIESDSDYSGFTSTRLTGDSAMRVGIDLINAAESGKLKSEREDEGITRFEIPGFADAQIFYFDNKDPNGAGDELVLVVRPLSIQKKVTIEV